jgi:hypothetical protein
MSRQLFYRNVQARDRLDIFLASAVTSLLLLRFYLSATGYPQVGGGTFHIAHMLWGGLLMVAAIVLNLAFIGGRVQRLGALVGGAGFGIFIDELGKFITKDNDYFFRPTIGIIYAIFVSLYLLFNFLSRRQRLSSREYQLNALSQLEEAVVHDMDKYEKARVEELLAHADSRSAITKQLKGFLKQVELVRPDQPNAYEKLVAAVGRQYRHFWQHRSSNQVVQWFFVTEAGLFLLAILASIYTSLDDISLLFDPSGSYGSKLLIGQLVSSLIAAGFALYGSAILQRRRLEAYEQFRRATLINLYLTEFFIFSRVQFGALPSFFFNLVLLLLINAAIIQEQRAPHEPA